jgi:hypothetical protein
VALPGAVAVRVFELSKPVFRDFTLNTTIFSDVRIRYSTVGVVPSGNSAEPSSGKLWR